MKKIKKMKKLVVLIFVLVNIKMVVAQNAEVIFFSEQLYPFTIFMNGVKYNEIPDQNVKIVGLNSGLYNIKIVFADQNLGEISRTIELLNGLERTFVIKEREITSGEKKLKKIGQTMQVGITKSREEVDQEQENIEEENSKLVLRLLNERRLENTQGRPVTEVVTTSTTVEEDDVTDIGVSVQINASEIRSDVVVSESSSTSSISVASDQVIYVLPGYSGKIGCPFPVSEADFKSMKNSITSKSFEDSKLIIAKQLIDGNCFLSAQVKEIMMIFSFEDTRLELAKYAYGKTYDISNYYLLNDAFDFESSIEELSEYINSYKW